jgi:copper chaperone CopZ
MKINLLPLKYYKSQNQVSNLHFLTNQFKILTLILIKIEAMKHFFVFLSFSFLVFSCSNNSEKKVVRVEKHKQYEKLENVVANRQLAIEVEGMTCEHACGGSIRMALMDTKAVNRVKFDFVTDRKVNTAYVYFDKSKINADEIVKIIEDLNEGQFTTHKIESSSFEDKKLKAEVIPSSTKSDNCSPIEIKSNSYELPSLMGILKSFIF